MTVGQTELETAYAQHKAQPHVHSRTVSNARGFQIVEHGTDVLLALAHNEGSRRGFRPSEAPSTLLSRAKLSSIARIRPHTSA